MRRSVSVFYPEDEQFAERSIRNWVGDQDDLQTTSEKLGHASTDTTNKHYRSNVTKVKPFNLPINNRGSV